MPSLNSLSRASCTPRIVQGINTAWKFHKGDDAPKGGQEEAYWEEVNLPHTWNAEDVMDDNPGYYRGVGWYQKDVFIPSDWQYKDVYIYFEGASQVTEVFINGESVGSHIGAYTAFNFNITDRLQEGENSIRVKVDNSPNPDIIPLPVDFSIYGGVYRDLYLVVVDRNHFDMDNYASSGVFVSTPQVSQEMAIVQVRGKVSIKQDVKVVTAIYDRDGNKVSEVIDTPHEDGCFSADIKNFKSPHLWSPDDPYLYRVVSSLVDAKDGTLFDEVINPLGLRWYSFDSENGFILNGKPLKLMGASRHQDFKGLGSALPDALHVNDVQCLKDMGGNFMRVSHFPQDPSIMEACDRLGILASMETPGCNGITESEEFARVSLEMQREMIRQYYNHPSVIIWSYMNEVLLGKPYKDNTPELERYWKKVHDLAVRIEEMCREEDPGRYTMIAYDELIERYKSAGLLSIPMIAGWNLYKGWYIGEFKDFESFLLKFRDEYPDKPMLITEYGADSDYRLHNFTPSRFDKTQEYANRFHEAYLPVINKYPFIAGGAMWLLFDFVSSGRQEATPHLNTKGILTTDRKPKEAYYIYKAWYSKRPFVKVGGTDWPSRAQCADEGSDTLSTQPVAVYSNQSTVSLWANGAPLGTQKTLNGKAVYSVRFRNGANTLRAVTENGSEDFVTVQFHVVANNLKSTENSFTTLNVSLGDCRMFMDDLTFEAWIPEKAYSPGSWGYVGGRVYKENDDSDRYGSPRNILGTRLKAIYQTQRVGLSAFNADVPDGVYEITFHFSELLTAEHFEKMINDLVSNSGDESQRKDIERRSFDVVINNAVFLSSLSQENYLAPIRAYSTKAIVSVKEGKGISIQFIAHRGEAILNGIQIRKTY